MYPLSRMLFFAMAFAILPDTAFAMSKCPDEYTFERRVSNADLIFQGRLKNYDVLKYDDLKEISGFNFNKKSTFFVTENYFVDKAWKNTKKGETVSLFFCMPLEMTESGARQFLTSYASQSGDIGKHKIWVIKQSDDPRINNALNSCDCGTGSYDVASEYVSALNSKFPSAAGQ